MIELVPWMVATLAVGVAAVFFGLWMGERGRRIDAQMREGVLPTPPRWKAKVTPPAGTSPNPNEELREAKQRYVDDAVREGYPAKDAAEEFDRLMGELYSDRGVG